MEEVCNLILYMYTEFDSNSITNYHLGGGGGSVYFIVENVEDILSVSLSAVGGDVSTTSNGNFGLGGDGGGGMVYYTNNPSITNVGVDNGKKFPFLSNIYQPFPSDYIITCYTTSTVSETATSSPTPTQVEAGTLSPSTTFSLTPLPSLQTTTATRTPSGTIPPTISSTSSISQSPTPTNSLSIGATPSNTASTTPTLTTTQSASATPLPTITILLSSTTPLASISPTTSKSQIPSSPVNSVSLLTSTFPSSSNTNTQRVITESASFTPLGSSSKSKSFTSSISRSNSRQQVSNSATKTPIPFVVNLNPSRSIIIEVVQSDDGDVLGVVSLVNDQSNTIGSVGGSLQSTLSEDPLNDPFVISPVIDVIAVDRFGQEIVFNGEAEICIKVPENSKITDNSCLGYLEVNRFPNEWICEDPCVEYVEELQQICGTTTHFTSFAVLFEGKGGGDSLCGSSENGYIFNEAWQDLTLIGGICLICCILSILFIILGSVTKQGASILYGTESRRIAVLRSNRSAILIEET